MKYGNHRFRLYVPLKKDATNCVRSHLREKELQSRLWGVIIPVVGLCIIGWFWFTKLFLNHFCDIFGITGVAAQKVPLFFFFIKTSA